MPLIRLPAFGGMIPAIDKHLLPDTAASYSENGWLYSGALSGLPEPFLLHTTAPGTQAVFRIPGNTDDPAYLPDSLWMEFEDPNTDVIKAPVANDQFNRYYWTSGSTPPRYNTRDRIAAGQPPFTLGIPQPNSLTVTASGGTSGTQQARAYVHTLVSAYGEEGPPSNPILLTGNNDGTWSVTIPAVPAAQMGTTHNITRVRVYRTITSSSGVSSYNLVEDRAASTSAQTFNDTVSATVLAGRAQLESLGWSAPPADLDGFIVLANGVVAGWRQNEIWFCEPYRPHAWPAAYTLVCEFNIVGLGVINQALVVCTEGHPVVVSGVNPASMSMAKLTSFEPCLSRGSIISAPEGVYYTSPNGLVMVNPGVADNVTRKVITRDVWDDLTDTVAMRAGRLGTAYFAYGSGSSNAFQDTDAFQLDAFQSASNVSGSNRGFLLDVFNENAGIHYLFADGITYNVFNDFYSGELLVIRDNQVLWYNLGMGAVMAPYKWRSKAFQTPRPLNFSAFKAYFYEDNSMTGTPDHSLDQQELSPMQRALVRIYADGRHIATRELTKSGDLHRLPSGFLAEFWEIEIEARVRFKSFLMGSTVKELRNV
jgi:hypothetical protein